MLELLFGKDIDGVSFHFTVSPRMENGIKLVTNSHDQNKEEGVYSIW